MLAVREGKEAVCARNFSEALRKAVMEKRLMGRAVDGSEERSTTGMPGLDLNKLLEQMARGGFRGESEFRGAGGTARHTKGADSRDRKVPPSADTPVQDPDVD